MCLDMGGSEGGGVMFSFSFLNPWKKVQNILWAFWLSYKEGYLIDQFVVITSPWNFFLPLLHVQNNLWLAFWFFGIKYKLAGMKCLISEERFRHKETKPTKLGTRQEREEN